MKNRAFTLVEIMITVLIIGVLVGIALPNFMSARSRSQAKTCIANLRSIEGAKEQWAMEKKRGATDVPVTTDLVGTTTDGYIKSFPTCPSGGSYSPENMITRPTCSKSADGHALE